MVLLTEWSNKIDVDDRLETFTLPIVYAFGVHVARLLPDSLGLLLQQHNSKGFGQENEYQESTGETHDSAEPIVPSPTEVASGNEIPHDRRKNWSAKDGTNASGHSYASTDRVPHVYQGSSSNGKWCRAEDTTEEAAYQDRLDVLA